MANIDSYLENILTAVYGEEVRSSIHDAISAMNEEIGDRVVAVTDTFNALTQSGVAADALAIHNQALLIRDTIKNNTDLDEVGENGVYRLVSSADYTHSPLVNSSTGWLVVFFKGDAGNNGLQIVYETGTNEEKTYNSYFRAHNVNNGWGEWQSGGFSLDTTLTVSGSAADAKAVGDRFAALEYFPITITNFNVNATTEDGTNISVTIEDGEVVSFDNAEKGSVITSLSYQWITNKEPTKVTLEGSEIPIDSTHKTYNQGTLTSLNVKNNKTWTLKVKDSGNGSSITSYTDTIGATIKFLYRVYWGVAEDQTDPDSAFVESFRSTSKLAEGLGQTFTVTAPTGNYIWFAYPKDFGLPEFVFNGFKGGFKLIKQMTFTNKYSVTTTYYIYRSVQPSLGNVTITVNSPS